MREKLNLNTAGGRLRYSIECLYEESFNDFAKNCKSFSGRNLYLLIKENELTLKRIKPLLDEFPELPGDYIVKNDLSKKPYKEIEGNLQLTSIEKRLEMIEKSLSELPRITNLLERCLEVPLRREPVSDYPNSS